MNRVLYYFKHIKFKSNKQLYKFSIINKRRITSWNDKNNNDDDNDNDGGYLVLIWIIFAWTCLHKNNKELKKEKKFCYTSL